MEIRMRRRRDFILIAICAWLLFQADTALAQFGELPRGAVSASRMGAANEIVLYVAFDPAVVPDLVPAGLRLRTLEEVAARAHAAVADYLRSHPEHGGWAASVVEIIRTESLEYDGYTARPGERGGMAVWYAFAARVDSSDPGPKGAQMSALGTWLSDRKLVQRMRAKGYPAEYASIEYRRDRSGIVRGELKTEGLRIRGRCRPAGNLHKPDWGEPTIFQTIRPPHPLAETFEVITYCGHLHQDCRTAVWQFEGGHPLVRAFRGRAEGGLEVSGIEYYSNYVLRGGLYRRQHGAPDKGVQRTRKSAGLSSVMARARR